MMDIIAHIIFCMIAASLLGFIIGWIFSTLLRNEKHQSQILAVREKFDEQKAQINQLETKVDTKNREILTIKEQYGVMKKEMISHQIDDENDDILRSKLAEAEVENMVLLEQIKEQKICEDENAILQVELKELEIEKQKLIERIEELKEFETSYKDNIHRIAELESRQKKDKTTHSEDKKHPKKANKKSKEQVIGLNKICDDKKIITDKDLIAKDMKKDKISKIIENLFSNQKIDKE
jgi:hypothetical protein